MASTYLPLHLVVLFRFSILSGNTGDEPPFWCQLIRSGDRCDRVGALASLVVQAFAFGAGFIHSGGPNNFVPREIMLWAGNEAGAGLLSLEKDLQPDHPHLFWYVA